MDTLFIKDVRCFRGDNKVRLAPITLLVGENSTGKSTLLALTRIAWDVAYGLTEPNFNEDPFQLGSYNELARFHGGQAKRVRSFSVGFSEAHRTPGAETSGRASTSIVGTFTAEAGQPILTRLRIERGRWRIDAEVKLGSIAVEIVTPSASYSLKSGSDEAFHALSVQNLALALRVLRFPPRRANQPDLFEGSFPSGSDLETIFNILAPYSRPRFPGHQGSREAGRPYATAPIRTKPKRTYDPLRDVRSPEGDHVPMLLARLSATEQPLWAELTAALSDYGSQSGLFEEIKIRRFGRAGSDKEASPFQIMVRLPGQPRESNLVDVGYGVSQVLPILVDCLSESPNAFFLMQQPEVHLHPRAQAELGSFIVQLTRRRRQRFVIETHSDHLVDRIRLEVRKGVLPPESVSILFFQRSGATIKIHDLRLDPAGNPLGQPDGYRAFFLEEELKLIGV